MPLPPGARLGPYEIVSPIGAGGMGEVYKARDTRLARTVAIKILPSQASGNPEARQRFEREARAISALDHPHICALYDVGHQDGVDFLVMQHLEGETLAGRLTRGALPVDEALRYAIEIGEALALAHQQGVVHRDLKPANVMLATTGSARPSAAKLLDFGLAKLRAPHVVEANGATLAMQSSHLTAAGTILGTLHYMAPEQLEGKATDARTDIFAFGALVYEMVTGRPAFEGSSPASVIAATLNDDPPRVLDRQPQAPPALDRVVRKGLAKNPDERWQSVRDLTDELKWMAQERLEPGQVTDRATSPGPSLMTTGRWIGALVASTVIVAALVWSVPRREVASQPVRRFTIEPPAGATLEVASWALSPRGRYVVYEAQSDQGRQFHLQALDQIGSRVLPGTDGGLNPVFSPDEQWIAFWSDGKLKKLSLSSGTAQIPLGHLGQSIDQSLAWLPDDTIVASRVGMGLVRVPTEGGSPVDLTKPDKEGGEIDHHNPAWLPGGRALLLTSHRGEEAFDVAVHRLDTGGRRVLVKDAFDARYVPTGHLVFARPGLLLAAPFNLHRLEVTGPEVVMLEDLQTTPGNGAARYRLADDGSLAYVPIAPRQGRRLIWLDRRGGIELLPVGPRAFGTPSLSPDGGRVAVEIEEASGHDIWIVEIGTGALTRVTFDGTSEAPVWTPDGGRIVFSSIKDGRRQLYWQPADGTGRPELLLGEEHSVWAGSWSPDGKTLAYTRQPPTDQTDIGLLRLGQLPPAASIVASEEREQGPRVSPDGRWLAYMAQTKDVWHIYVIELTGSGGKRQLTADGGVWPVWSRDGRELLYRNRGRFMVVPVGSLPGRIGPPTELPGTARPLSRAGHPGYDVAPDGRLLIVHRAEEEVAPRQIHVVLNWVEELKRRVPLR